MGVSYIPRYAIRNYLSCGMRFFAFNHFRNEVTDSPSIASRLNALTIEQTKQAYQADN